MAGKLAIFAVLIVALLSTGPRAQPTPPRVVEFVFTSDAHYGLTRPHFRGHDNVDARVVNQAMVTSINALPSVRLPHDDGVRAGETVGPIDFLVEGGDVANREETTGGAGRTPIQPAARSWAEFRRDYIDRLSLKNASGEPSAIFVIPGNHDASDVVGFYKPMQPLTDATAMAEIYNLMVRPPVRVTAATYQYDAERVLTSRNIGRLHLVFLHIWPDSRARDWMESDLRSVPTSMPVLLFAHDQPEAQAKHFINPNGQHDVNALDKFEDLLADQYADGAEITGPTTIEQRALAAFLKRHPNIRAYFHGNSNWTEFYDWRDPDRTIALATFRVDSPMKGKASEADERRLAFELATVDVTSMRMTVRECLWNADPAHPAAPIEWGGYTHDFARRFVPLAERTVSCASAVRVNGAILDVACVGWPVFTNSHNSDSLCG